MQMQLLIKTYQTEADIQEELNEAIRYAKRKGLIPTTDDEWEELKETADADSD